MADFRTHVAVASTVSGVIAIGGMVAGVATPKEVVLFFALARSGECYRISTPIIRSRSRSCSVSSLSPWHS